ncbi:stage II sporulation protein E [Candidatus Magnetobacterium bavaricum]|uniref:histidine kinase n=1 Tax=Candidatus Magnetobacterium bavaricum TaxID=29290 RepID=A0A0F3GPK7_9BACT|nr:stage II sporulation protein E [Candidatus Magnetobacterium bavaricum]
MIEIKGYKVVSKIEENTNSVVYRAIGLEDDITVIIKLLRDEYPSQKSITRYKQEYEITSRTNLKGIIHSYEIVKHKNTLAIVFEDIGGQSLKALSKANEFTMKDVLLIGCKIADALGEMHSVRIIHKDINPSNIVLNPDTGQIKIIDFGISTVLSRQETDISLPELIEGTLAYISPEQTGRVNMPIDYRTDYYSLGVTLYELLCHRLPFAMEDPMDIIFSHITREPAPPHEINPDMAVPVSDVIMKLLKKAPSDRYQSAYGIKADLDNCIRLLNGDISTFVLGRYEVPHKLQISQSLYGRDNELSYMVKRYGEVSIGGCEMMLVYGYSGIGKTSLIRQLYRPISNNRGYFLSGKFDQFQRDIPCSAIVSAFRGLVRQILSESRQQLNRWQERFRQSLGKNGQIIIDVIAEMELIIGEQPPVQELPPVEAQNRFNEVFTAFIRQFAQREHPLVIFLDDLQWADASSLKLIELLMLNREIGYLLFIGAYRDNEVTPTHPLILTVDRLKKSDAIINTINLGPLSRADVTQLVTDTLRSQNGYVSDLVDIIIRKTLGNPFFITQFLKRLYEDGLIKFIPYDADNSTEEGFGWVCDIALISQADITNNVVDLMVEKLKRLPQLTQHVLSMAACMGNKFDLDTISLVTETQSIEVYKQLTHVIDEELILCTSPLEITKEDILIAKPIITNFKFLHDRVQQAANALLDQSKIASIHYSIGRRLIEHMGREITDRDIFTVLEHLNKGRSLISSPQELTELCRLNLQAAKKAKESTAYQASLSYLQSGMEMLSDSIWDSNYELAKETYKERATVEYLNNNDNLSEKYIYAALEHIKTSAEKAELLNILIVQYTMRARYKDAIKTAREALHLVGIILPQDDDDLVAARDEQLRMIMEMMGDKTIRSLMDLPAMTDKGKIIAMRLLTSLGPPCYRSHQRLWAIIIPIEVGLCLRYGDVSSATYTYPSIGGLFGYVFNDFKSTAEYAVLTEQLCKKYNNPSDRSVAYLMIGSSLRPWYKHIRHAEQDYNEAYQAGLESGNLQYSGYAFGHKTYCMFYYGKPLNELEEELPKLIEFSQKRQNRWAIDLITGVEIIVSTLRGTTDGVLRYNEITEDEYLHQCAANVNTQVLCIYYILKMQVLYLDAKFREALTVSEEVEKRIISVATQSLLPTAEYRFYHALVIASLYTSGSEEDKTRYMQLLISGQQQMRIWADGCQENFLHKYYLISAEIARINGQDMEAVTLYEQSIQSAKDNGFIQVEALANELMARFWLQKGNNRIARLYINESAYAYSMWGARYKVHHLKTGHPALFESMKETQRQDFLPPVIHTTASSVVGYDLASIMKSTQVITSEMNLDKLLPKMMKIITETAGAQRGGILFLSDGQIYMEAFANSQDIQVLNSIPLSSEYDTITYGISGDIVRYVANTGEVVIVHNASEDERFASDPYISKNHPKSILSLPIIHTYRTLGVVYLENNLMTEAFSTNRIDVLNILVPQMAISIENAHLYKELKQINETLKYRIDEEVNISRQKDFILINQSKMASLGELLINIAHQWRQPMNVISTLMFEIKDAYDYGELNKEHLYKTLDKASSQIQYMSGAIDHFRDLYKTTPAHEAFEIRACIDEAASFVYDQLKSQDITLRFGCCLHKGVFGKASLVSCCSETRIVSHKNELMQVLLSLINNAADAIVEKRSKDALKWEGIIDISFCRINGTFRIEIRDNGGGIPDAILDRIYEPYFTTKFKKQGTGLGLYMSKMIIESNMNGKIYGQNVKDGAMFTIELGCI